MQTSWNHPFSHNVFLLSHHYSRYDAKLWWIPAWCSNPPWKTRQYIIPLILSDFINILPFWHLSRRREGGWQQSCLVAGGGGGEEQRAAVQFLHPILKRGGLQILTFMSWKAVLWIRSISTGSWSYLEGSTGSGSRIEFGLIRILELSILYNF